MTELVDVLDLGSSGGDSVQVRALLPAPRRNKLRSLRFRTAPSEPSESCVSLRCSSLSAATRFVGLAAEYSNYSIWHIILQRNLRTKSLDNSLFPVIIIIVCSGIV